MRYTRLQNLNYLNLKAMTAEFFQSSVVIDARFISINPIGQRSNGALSFAQPFDARSTLESLIQNVKTTIQQDLTGEGTVSDAVLLTRLSLIIETNI